MPPTRTDAPGDELRLLVLAVTQDEVIGVDLASGAFVRGMAPEDAGSVLAAAGAMAPFDVAALRLGAPARIGPQPPEAAELAAPPSRLGRLRGRRAARYLRRLVHPAGVPLLGFSGPSIPFWTFNDDRPTVALVARTGDLALGLAGDGPRCRFAWRGGAEDLPLADPRALDALGEAGGGALRGEALAGLLGWRPDRLVVALSAPRDGYCHKEVVALLPRR